MGGPVWCVELAAAFWAKAGPPPPFPRDLAGPAAFFGVGVEPVAGLSVAAVRGWFRARQIAVPFAEPDRPLRGCLVAWRGVGFVFLDPADAAAERRFTLAHEVAHFLRDYWHPRETVRRRLGDAALGVLDGDRPPTPAERVAAVLRGVRVGPFAHLLARDDRGVPASDAEREAEAAADRLAFELLAPEADVGEGATGAELEARFGLPKGAAGAYAARLAPPAEPAWAARLRGP